MSFAPHDLAAGLHITALVCAATLDFLLMLLHLLIRDLGLERQAEVHSREPALGSPAASQADCWLRQPCLPCQPCLWWHRLHPLRQLRAAGRPAHQEGEEEGAGKEGEAKEEEGGEGREEG